jgi:hypothetical protein
LTTFVKPHACRKCQHPTRGPTSRNGALTRPQISFPCPLRYPRPILAVIHAVPCLFHRIIPIVALCKTKCLSLCPPPFATLPTFSKFRSFTPRRGAPLDAYHLQSFLLKCGEQDLETVRGQRKKERQDTYRLRRQSTGIDVLQDLEN